MTNQEKAFIESLDDSLNDFEEDYKSIQNDLWNYNSKCTYNEQLIFDKE